MLAAGSIFGYWCIPVFRSRLTKVLAMDCEFVGVGPDGMDNMLAVSCDHSVLLRVGGEVHPGSIIGRQEDPFGEGWPAIKFSFCRNDKAFSFQRVSLVNAHGECVYDKYVKATEPVTDYRTAVSGIREENLASGKTRFWDPL